MTGGLINQIISEKQIIKHMLKIEKIMLSVYLRDRKKEAHMPKC